MFQTSSFLIFLINNCIGLDVLRGSTCVSVCVREEQEATACMCVWKAIVGDERLRV